VQADRDDSTARLRFPLLGLGFALLLAAWLVATQPFAAPDEASHYLRAMSIANGSILGPKIPYGDPQLTPTQEAFVDHDTRAVSVPARMSPPDVGCIDRKPDLRGSCFEATPDGNFPPLGYFLPAAALSASHDASTGLWLTRVASALQSLVFLLLAVAVLWDGTGWSLIGIAAATTPMVLFASSVMNSSGIEVTSSLAFASAALRVTRAPSRVPLWVWVAFALAGAVAILAGPIGITFAAASVALFIGLLGRRGLRELGAENVRPLCLATMTLVAAGVLALIYDRLAGFSTTVGFFPIRRSLRQGVDQLPAVLRDAVGTFGSLTVHLPTAAHWIWWLFILVLIAAALRLGEAGERLVAATVVLLAVAFPVLFYAWVDRFSGFGLQGREVLPPLTLIPLFAGEVIYRRRAALDRQRLAQRALGGALALVALFQGYAWWLSARAAAGAPHIIRFFAHAAWSPPFGWMPWILSAGAGTLALLIFAVNEGLGGRLLRPSPRKRAVLVTDESGRIGRRLGS
jgi:hypothetical protein